MYEKQLFISLFNICMNKNPYIYIYTYKLSNNYFKNLEKDYTS